MICSLSLPSLRSNPPLTFLERKVSKRTSCETAFRLLVLGDGPQARPLLLIHENAVGAVFGRPGHDAGRSGTGPYGESGKGS